MLKPRDEIFCQQVALGKSAAEAYRLCGGKAKRPEVEGCKKVMKSNISTRIQELRAQAASISALSKADLISFLASVITTPVGSVEESSRLAQEVTTTEGPMGVTRKVRMPGKIDAVRELAKLCGFYEPDKVQVSGLSGLLAKLTGVKP